MDDRWERRAKALSRAKETYEWKRMAIERLLAEAKAEFDAAVLEANAMIPKIAAKPRDRLEEKAARMLAYRESTRSSRQ